MWPGWRWFMWMRETMFDLRITVYLTALSLAMPYIEGPTSPPLGTYYLRQSSIRSLFGFFFSIFFVVIRKRNEYSHSIDPTIWPSKLFPRDETQQPSHRILCRLMISSLGLQRWVVSVDHFTLAQICLYRGDYFVMDTTVSQDSTGRLLSRKVSSSELNLDLPRAAISMDSRCGNVSFSLVMFHTEAEHSSIPTRMIVLAFRTAFCGE